MMATNFFDELPEDITHRVSLTFLHYKDAVRFARCDKYLYTFLHSFLFRYYCCGNINCQSPLFHPSNIQQNDFTIKCLDGDTFIIDPQSPLFYPLDNQTALQSYFETLAYDRMLYEMMKFNKSELIKILRNNIEDVDNEIAEKIQIIVSRVICGECKLFVGIQFAGIKCIDSSQVGQYEEMKANFEAKFAKRFVVCKKHVFLKSIDPSGETEAGLFRDQMQRKEVRQFAEFQRSNIE